MTWRPISESDLDACLDIRPERLGAAEIGDVAARKVWRGWLRHPAFRHAAIESDPHIRGHRIVGFGASVLVTPEFATDALENPRPDINSRVVTREHQGKSVLLTRDQIGKANAGAGSDLAILYGNILDDILDPTQCMEAAAASGASILGCHAGYRLHRVLHEIGRLADWRLVRGGTLQRHSEFPGTERVLFAASREATGDAVGTIGQMAFVYRKPVLRLTPSEQDLLTASLSGATDEELSASLGLTVTAVKARWRAIFSRLSDRAWNDAPGTKAMSKLLDPLRADSEVAIGASSSGRGVQKRHRLVEYVRRHPEELRPYAWD